MFEDMTPEKIKREMLEEISKYCGGLSIREGSFVDTLVGGLALEQYKMLQSLNAIVPIAYIDETSGAYIDRACARYGITRKAGTKAAVMMTLTGKSGTKIPQGTVFLTLNGLGFILDQAVTLTGESVTAPALAESVGSAYNVEAGALTQMIQTISGLESWGNTAGEGGTDPEPDGALVRRYYDYLQKPAASGNALHYEQWAMEVDGVGAAKIFPLWDGPGTVKVVLLDADRRPAAQAIVDAAAAHIEAERPIGASVTVCSAEPLEITVRYAAELEEGADPAEIQAAFASRLGAYIQGLAFQADRLIYNRVALLLLTIPGVRDYTALTVNGGADNLPIGQEQVAVLGEVAAL